MQNIFEIFNERLPNKPYCTDNFSDGLIIRSRNTAISKRFIQPNPPVLKYWLTYDVDRVGAAFAWEDANLSPPHFAVINPENAHAHLIYGLEVPVCISDAARLDPIRFAGAVDVAYMEALKADRSYSGLICKNPANEDWKVISYNQDLYDLEYMADFIDLKPYSDRRKNLPDYGLGRNVTLFTRTAKWSYREIRIYWKPGGFNGWFEAVLYQCEKYNNFDSPLPYSEVKATAKSIARWTWNKMTPDSFRFFVENTHTSEIQSKRGKKGGKIGNSASGAIAAAKVKRDNREKEIKAAIEALSISGKKPTKAAVSRVVGISKSAITMHYSHLF